MVTIQTQLSQKDYIQASMIILYRKPLVFIVSFLLCILLVVNVGLLLTGFKITPDAIALPVVLLFITPFSTYISSRRAYRANKTAGMQLNYEFKGNTLRVTANGGASEVKISDFRKAFKTSKWLFFVNNTRNVSPLPRKNISDNQVSELKNILDTNGVRNNF